MRKKVTIFLLLILFVSVMSPIGTTSSREPHTTNIIDTNLLSISSNTTTWRYVNSIKGIYSYPSQYLDVATYSLHWISGVDINSYSDREDYTSELKGTTFWTMKVDHVSAQPYSSGELYDDQYNTTFSTTENESLLFIIKTKVYMPTFTLKIKAEGKPYWYSYNWISYPALVNTSDSEYILSHTITNSTDYLDTEGNIYIAILVGGEMYYTGSSTTQKGYCRWYIFNRTSASWDRIIDDGPYDVVSYTQSSTTNYVRDISHIVFALDYFAITYPSSNTYVNHYVATNDTVVIHKLEMSASIANTRLTLSSLSPDWAYWYSEPQLSYDGYRTFTFPNSGKYSVYFISYDTWNYPNYEQSRVAYLNSKGEYLDFDQFHTYIAESPSRLIRYAPDVNDEDLVAWFRFNEGTGNYTYDWKQGLEGIINGSTWTTGYIGDAIHFNGSGGVTTSGFDFRDTDFSLEVWVKLDDNNQSDLYPMIFHQGSSTESRVILRFDGQDTRPNVDFILWNDGSSQLFLSAGEGINWAQWHHIVATFNHNTLEARIYIDGGLYASATASSRLTYDITSYDFYIGSGPASDNQLEGILDEPRIYFRLLEPEEVWWHYSLALYYDGQKDMLGRTSSGSVTSYTSGVFGTASEFDGVDDYVGVFNDTSLQQRDGFTIVTYFKASSGTNVSLYRWYEYGCMLRLVNGYVNFSYYDHSANLHTLASADTYTDNEWHLIVAVKTFDEMFLYIDGDLEANTTITGEPDVYYGSGGGAIGRDGDASSGYFEGYIDELLLLNQPISPEMAENLWKIAKPYIGGYYTDTEFKTTWQIEQDSPEDGNGFSEDFSDISEWSSSTSAGASIISDTTDGDVETLHVEFIANTATDWVLKSVDPDPDIDLTKYPFLEIRWKGESNASTSFRVHLYFTNGSGGSYEIATALSRNGNFDWTISRLNVLEKLKQYVSWTSYYLYLIRLEVNDYPDNDAQWAKLYVDWLRVYGFDGASIINSMGDTVNSLATSIGGILSIQGTFASTSNEYFEVKYDFPDISTDNLYLEVRMKTSSSNAWAMIYYYVDTTLHSYATTSTSWVTIRINLSSLGSTLKYIYLAINDVDNSLASGTYYAYFDYIRIGYEQEKIQDTSWESLLYPIYEHPKSGYVWFNVTDIFGNSLIYEPRSYAVYQDFVLPLYSWKFKNNKDNTFIHVNISQNGFHWSEWLAPKEVARYDLYSGNYTLRITYPDNSYFETTISVTQDYYWMLSGNTLGDVLTGIDNLYYNITNVNQTLYNQIINVNISMTNWNSEINNTVVNININLDNVNSTLYNEIINIDASINNLQTNVTWQIQNLSISMNNNFTNIQTQITTVNNTVLSVNSTLIRVNNTIINQITNLNNSMTYQFTHVITNITNVNNTLYQQTQTIKEDIVDLAHTEYRNPPPEPTKVPVVGDLVTSEAGQVIAGFGIILAIIFAFMYVVERGRRISIEEERSAKRMINALKK